ncbi:MAG: tripartite tricarboxylate transporter substrate binding protein [Pseudomonadota bacterium]|nr:tripartite tricarboxylate transporter substrate binding protein [Pseudomonadota bacterium]
MKKSSLLGAAAIAIAATYPAFSQNYPTKTVKIIAPVQPGGGVDLTARTVAEQLTKSMGQSFIVENVSGGGGVIASQNVARAAPDGYTLMLGYVATHGTVPAVRKVPYDAVKDFTPIAMVAGTPNVLVVGPNVPATDMKSFVAWAKANKSSYGSAGQGSLTHLAMEQFRTAAGFDSVHAAYRGIGPAITDVLGGQTQMMMPGLAAATPHIKAGKLKPIAVTGLMRHPLLPDVPTFEELGYKGFTGVQWYAIVGPAKMPADVVKRLNDEINKAIATPELRQRLSGEALEPMPMTPEQFGKFMQDDIAKWAKLAQERGIKLEE